MLREKLMINEKMWNVFFTKLDHINVTHQRKKDIKGQGTYPKGISAPQWEQKRKG